MYSSRMLERNLNLTYSRRKRKETPGRRPPGWLTERGHAWQGGLGKCDGDETYGGEEEGDSVRIVGPG